LTGPYCLRFPRRPRFRRSSLVPPTTMGSLSTHRSALPDHPGSPTPVGLLTQLHLLRSLKSPCESVLADTSHPAPPADTLLSFHPLQRTLKGLGASNPRGTPKGTPHAPSPGGSSMRPQGQQPLEPGETSPTHEYDGLVSSATSSPLQDWAASPLGDDSFSPGLGPADEPPSLTLGAFKYP